MKSSRIETRFAELKKIGRPALVTFVMAGDPDMETSLEILKALPESGVDVIEIGMPFSDPMADGPSIQLAGQRALAGGQTLVKTLKIVSQFRKTNKKTPIILMGYYNPIYIFGVEKFLKKAKSSGVDGLIVVDLPPEEDDELCIPALKAGISFIRLTTPTTDDKRLDTVLTNTSGFVYYVSITGITGTALPKPKEVAASVARIKAKTDLPVVVGFGVKSPAQATAIGKGADGVVVGSAIVNVIKDSLSKKDKATRKTVPAVKKIVKELAAGVAKAGKKIKSK